MNQICHVRGVTHFDRPTQDHSLYTTCPANETEKTDSHQLAGEYRGVFSSIVFSEICGDQTRAKSRLNAGLIRRLKI